MTLHVWMPCVIGKHHTVTFYSPTAFHSGPSHTKRGLSLGSPHALSGRNLIHEPLVYPLQIAPHTWTCPPSLFLSLEGSELLEAGFPPAPGVPSLSAPKGVSPVLRALITVLEDLSKTLTDTQILGGLV